MRVGTYNVLIPRDDTPGKSQGCWEERKSAVVDTIDSSFDLVGLQECSTLPDHRQASYLVEELTARGWSSYRPWEHKLFADEFHERLPIFWRPELFSLLESGQFLLSSWTDEELLEVPTLENRYASFVKLQSASGGVLWFYTLHLQHETSKASPRELVLARAKREESQRRIADHILSHRAAADEIVVVGGDFNTAEPSRSLLEHIDLEDAFKGAERSKNWDHNSFHDWRGLRNGEHIDHLFCGGSAEILEAEIVLSDASDHYPVRAVLELSNAS